MLILTSTGGPNVGTHLYWWSICWYSPLLLSKCWYSPLLVVQMLIFPRVGRLPGAYTWCLRNSTEPAPELRTLNFNYLGKPQKSSSTYGQAIKALLLPPLA